MAIDWTKPIQTRDRRVAKALWPSDGIDDFMYVAVRAGNWREVVAYAVLKDTGKVNFAEEPLPSDIVNVPETRTVKMYFSAWTDGRGHVMASSDPSYHDHGMDGEVQFTQDITFEI